MTFHKLSRETARRAGEHLYAALCYADPEHVQRAYVAHMLAMFSPIREYQGAPDVAQPFFAQLRVAKPIVITWGTLRDAAVSAEHAIAQAPLPFSGVLVLLSAPLPAAETAEMAIAAFLSDREEESFLWYLPPLPDDENLLRETVIEQSFPNAVPLTSSLYRLLRYAVSAPVSEVQRYSAGERHTWRKKLGVLPQPYYVMRPRVRASEGLHEGLPEDARSLAWRHDRAAHLRLLVRRGWGLVSSEDRASLVRRGYVIYDGTDELGEKAQAHLSARGHEPKQEGEWIALRVAHVSETIVGPEDAPYVPSVRVTRPQLPF